MHTNKERDRNIFAVISQYIFFKTRKIITVVNSQAVLLLLLFLDVKKEGTFFSSEIVTRVSLGGSCFVMMCSSEKFPTRLRMSRHRSPTLTSPVIVETLLYQQASLFRIADGFIH